MNQSSLREINLPDNYRLRRASLKGRTAAILVVFSLIMQALSQEPANLGWLAWFCLAPWAIAAATYASRIRGTLLFYGSALIYFLIILRWLIPVTSAGWLGLCLYLAVYYLACGFIIRKIYLKKRWPLTLVLPVLWSGQEYLRSVVMTGFPWFFLSHSQHNNLPLIQIADMTGTYGITFILAMTNGLICDFLLRPLNTPQENGKSKPLSPFRLTAITFTCILVVFGYGQIRLNQIHKTNETGPTLTMIQDNVPQSNKPEFNDPTVNQWDTLFNSHLELTRMAMENETKPDLIVWPETMAPYLNEEFLNFTLPGYDITDILATIDTHRRYDKLLSQTAKEGVGLLIGTPHFEYAIHNGYLVPGKQANAAMLYLPDGSRYSETYWKMHLVPFGETIPFKYSIPWLYRLLMRFTPYEYDYSVESGKTPTLFTFKTPKGLELRFAVAICYEDVIPYMPRKLIQIEDGEKKADFLLNISNDGWYLKSGLDGKPLQALAEIPQHLAICRFRAIENRIGIARAVNGGISAFIQPDGSLQATPLAGTLPEDPWHRSSQRGFLTDTIHTNPTISFYSIYGDLFGISTAILSAFFLFMPLMHRGKKNSHS